MLFGLLRHVQVANVILIKPAYAIDKFETSLDDKEQYRMLRFPNALYFVEQIGSVTASIE